MRIPIESSTSYRGRHYRPNWLALLAFVLQALAVGAVGALFSLGASRAWYAALAKPAWTPPAAWFGPIWTVLYVAMGTAAWLVWRERYHRARNAALLAYAAQMALNALWAPVFFGARSPGAALFLIVALWFGIAWTLREFSTVRTAAALLVLPYLAWVSLAAALNFNIWQHNP